MNLANGYWTNLNVKMDFVNRTLTVTLNQTFASTLPLLNDFSVSSTVDPVVFTYELFFSFYFNIQFYLAGFDVSQIDEILNDLNGPYVQKYTQNMFNPLFEQFLALDRDLFWSGCMRNVKINSFLVEKIPSFIRKIKIKNKTFLIN